MYSNSALLGPRLRFELCTHRGPGHETRLVPPFADSHSSKTIETSFLPDFLDSPSSFSTMDGLSELFSRLMTPEMMAEVEHQEMSAKSKSLQYMPPDPFAGKAAPIPNLKDLDESDPAAVAEAVFRSIQDVRPRYPPLEMLPCANVQVKQYTACENQARLACSACKLVSYCSKVTHLMFRCFIMPCNTL